MKMQVTLIQSEIEQALVNYINDQINVKPGMRITIELRATRGETGMQALVDIVPDNVVATVVEAAPTVVEAVHTPRARPAIVPKAAVTRVAPVTPQAVVANPEPEPTPLVDLLVQDEPAERELEPVAVAADEPVEPEVAAAPPKRSSIFAGLQKPVNTPAAV
jgi:hypothetical protein